MFDAIGYEDVNIVKRLISYGADLTFKNDMDLTALDVASPGMLKIINNFRKTNRIPPNPPKKIKFKIEIMKYRPGTVPYRIYL